MFRRAHSEGPSTLPDKEDVCRRAYSEGSSMLNHGTVWGLGKIVAEVLSARYKETSTYWEWQTSVDHVVNHVSCELKQLGCFVFVNLDHAERVEFWPNKAHPTRLEQVVTELTQEFNNSLTEKERRIHSLSEVEIREVNVMKRCILTIEAALRPEVDRCILTAEDIRLIIRHILKKGPESQPTLMEIHLLEQ